MQGEDAISPKANPSRTRAGVQDETAELFRRLERCRHAFAGMTDQEQDQTGAAIERVRRDLDAMLLRHLPELAEQADHIPVPTARVLPHFTAADSG